MIDKDNRTLEQVYRSAVSGLYARLRSNYDFIYRKLGNNGIKLIADMSQEYGLSVVQRAKTKLIKCDLISVAGYILRIFDTVGRSSNLNCQVDQSNTRIVIKVDRCPLNFNMTEMCRAHTNMEKTIVEELNPDLTYRIGKSIPAGDNCCEHIIEVKSKVAN